MEINHGIPPDHLLDDQLLEEHEQIAKFPILILNEEIPHLFQGRQWYIFVRYMSLHNECLRRGFKVQNHTHRWTVLNRHLFDFKGTYQPSIKDINESKARLNKRSFTRVS